MGFDSRRFVLSGSGAGLAGLVLLPLEEAKPDALAAFQARNRARFAPYAPRRTEEFYTPTYWRMARARSRRERRRELALRWVLTRSEDETVLAQINLDNIVRGAFQSAMLGYALDEGLEGRGAMTACLRQVTRHAFEELNLHRLMANHVPENTRSAAVLARLGFQREGVAKSYLRLNGVWRDHVLNSLINPDH